MPPYELMLLTIRTSAVGLLAGIALTATALAAPIQCPRVELSISPSPEPPKPNWISSALWANGKILAVDSALNRLLAISPTGEGTVVQEPKRSMPSLLAKSGRSFILKLVGLDALSVGEDLAVGSANGFLRTATNPEGKVGSIFQWVGLDDSILAFGSLRSPRLLPDGYELGFLRIPVSGAALGTRLIEPPRPPLKGDYYLLGYQYVAALGETGYFLRMESGAQVRLFELPPGAAKATELPATVIPEGFRTAPTFDATMHGPAEAPAVYAHLEQMTLAAGLYGGPDGKYLYLLTRQPGKSSVETDWQLFRIERDRVVGSFTLPTSAPEVTLVFSPETLFVIERADLNASGQQRIDHMLKVPMSLVSRAGLGGAERCAPSP